MSRSPISELLKRRHHCHSYLPNYWIIYQDNVIYHFLSDVCNFLSLDEQILRLLEINPTL